MAQASSSPFQKIHLKKMKQAKLHILIIAEVGLLWWRLSYIGATSRTFYLTNSARFGHSRQCGLQGKDIVVTTTLIAWSGFNPHPGHVVASLDKTFVLRRLFLLSCFEQAADSVDKNPKKFTRTFDQWKRQSRCAFLQARSSYAMKSERIFQ